MRVGRLVRGCRGGALSMLSLLTLRVFDLGMYAFCVFCIFLGFLTVQRSGGRNVNLDIMLSGDPLVPLCTGRLSSKHDS